MVQAYSKALVIVEGKGDESAVNRVLTAPLVQTHGTAREALDPDLLRPFAEKNGILLFLDPDGPGRSIRERLSKAFPNAFQAEVVAKEARKGRRVGVAYASDAALREAILASGVPLTEPDELLSGAALTALGLAGANATRQRLLLCRYLGIAPAKGRALALRLWALDLTAERIREILQEIGRADGE